MKVRQILDPSAVVADLSGTTKPEVLAQLCGPVARLNPGLRAERLLETLVEREKLSSTGLADGVAVPHGKLLGLPRLTASFGRSVSGVPFDSLDGKPARLFFAIFAPEAAGGDHLRVLARVSRILKDEGFRRRVLAAQDAAEIHRLICEADDAF
ncbi:MAG: PTS sugar transporter subunit IIA [Myxococcales bacterium]